MAFLEVDDERGPAQIRVVQDLLPAS